MVETPHDGLCVFMMPWKHSYYTLLRLHHTGPVCTVWMQAPAMCAGRQVGSSYSQHLQAVKFSQWQHQEPQCCEFWHAMHIKQAFAWLSPASFAVQNVDRLCCGMMFDTRGAKRAAGLKVAESSTELLLASQMGKLPVGKPSHAFRATARLSTTVLHHALRVLHAMQSHLVSDLQGTLMNCNCNDVAVLANGTATSCTQL